MAHAREIAGKQQTEAGAADAEVRATETPEQSGERPPPDWVEDEPQAAAEPTQATPAAARPKRATPKRASRRTEDAPQKSRVTSDAAEAPRGGAAAEAHHEPERSEASPAPTRDETSETQQRTADWAFFDWVEGKPEPTAPEPAGAPSPDAPPKPAKPKRTTSRRAKPAAPKPAATSGSAEGTAADERQPPSPKSREGGAAAAAKKPASRKGAAPKTTKAQRAKPATRRKAATTPKPAASAAEPPAPAESAAPAGEEALGPNGRPADPGVVETSTRRAEADLRTEFCQIGWWRGYVKSEFYAEAVDADGDRYEVATSPSFLWWKSEPPAQTTRVVAAHDALVDKLVRAGWQRDGQGWEWYEVRFRRLRPPRLVERVAVVREQDLPIE